MKPQASRRNTARARVGAAREALSRCEFCSRKCGVDRRAGELGPCGAGLQANWCGARLEAGEEADLCPCYAITLSGCDMRCAFCVTGETSWNARAGKPMNPSEVAAGAARAVEQGARTVQVLGGEPTIHLPSVLELVERLPEEAHLVYKTNGCCTSLSRDLLEGLFNTWLVDYKFGSDHCARRLAAAKDYTQAVRDTLLWARHHSRLIVRHLLMPGHVECCWKPVALWIAREMPGVEVSLRGGFWPAWKSRRLPELQGPCPPGEIESAADFARQLGLNLVPNGIENPVSMVDGGSEAELLLLPDGRLLSHHTTPGLAGLLNLVLPGTSPEPPLSPRALKAL